MFCVASLSYQIHVYSNNYNINSVQISPFSHSSYPPPPHLSSGKGLHHVAYKILTYLDAQSLCRAEQVCSDWYRVIAEGMLWKKLIAWKVRIDPVWNGLSERRGW